MLRLAAVLLFCLCFLPGCLSDSNTSTGLIAPTLVTADPTKFVGSVRCGSDLQTYVVTLIETTTGMLQTLGSSPPTVCNIPTSFGAPKVMSQHSYIADVDGYDRGDIVPEGGTGGGSRVMQDAVTMAIVLPRWTTTCGEIRVTTDDEEADAPLNPLRYPTIALDSTEVVLHGCLPFADSAGLDGGDGGATTGDTPPDRPADASSTAP